MQFMRAAFQLNKIMYTKKSTLKSKKSYNRELFSIFVSVKVTLTKFTFNFTSKKFVLFYISLKLIDV